MMAFYDLRDGVRGWGLHCMDELLVSLFAYVSFYNLSCSVWAWRAVLPACGMKVNWCVKSNSV